jgi:hypothetical protein
MVGSATPTAENMKGVKNWTAAITQRVVVRDFSLVCMPLINVEVVMAVFWMEVQTISSITGPF